VFTDSSLRRSAFDKSQSRTLSNEVDAETVLSFEAILGGRGLLTRVLRYYLGPSRSSIYYLSIRRLD
jgi:hypothetical protein